MSLGQLVLELQLNGNEFTVGLKKAEGALGQFVIGANRANAAVTRTQSSWSRLGHTIRDSVIVLALARDAMHAVSAATVGWQNSIIQTNAEMQRSIQLMKTFSKQTDPALATAEAMADVNMLLQKASNAPFSLSAITDTFVKLRVAGVEPLQQNFNALIDSVAAFGGTDQNLKRAGVAIQQMAGKGVISMEELRQQLGEAVPTAIQNMADGLGVSYAKLVKEISLGRVKSEPALIAMMREMELSFKGAAQNMMNTWGGAVAQLETEFKKLMLTIGGFEEGYQEGTYMHTVTAGIKQLTIILKDPAVQQGAKDFSVALTGIMQSMIDATKWIIDNRDAIVAWTKVIVSAFVAYKLVSIVGAIGGAMMKMGADAMVAGAGVMSSAANIKNGMGAMASGLGAMTQAGTRMSGAIGAAKGVLGAIGGVAAIATGPIGMLTAAVGAGAFAWWEYKESVDANIQSLIKMRGLQAGQMQLNQMNERTQDNLNEILRLEGAIASKRAAHGKNTANVKSEEAEIKRLRDENAKLEPAIAQAIANVASQAVMVEVSTAEVAISTGMEKVKKEQLAAMEKWRDKLAEDEKNGAKELSEELKAEKIKIEKTRLDAELDLYQQQMDKLNGEINKKQTVSPKGTIIALDENDIDAKKKAIDELRVKMGLLGDQQIDLMNSAKTMKDTNMLPGGGTGQKAQFDALSIAVDGFRKKLATMNAKVEETNPYMAQLEASIESLGGKKLPNFDKMVADGRAMAEQLWAQEKARTALTTANKTYTDSIERIDQIDKLVNAKLNKAEERNPWEKASADAQRYEDELTDLLGKMQEAQAAAADAQVNGGGQGQLEKLEEEAKKAKVAVEETRASIEKLKVSDTGKRMKEDADSIRENLMETTERYQAEYQRRTQWANEFYAKHQEALLNDTKAYEAYQEYRKQLEAEYQRNMESGLDAWIRENKDATDEYKSLWGNAMDSFVDTLADGIVEGKLQFNDFVEYILKEILRIQLAKAMASAAEAATSSGGWLSTIGNMAMSYFSGGASNGLSGAGAVSSSMGASQAGYSMDLSGFKAMTFAKGGVMSKYGSLALREYANGGIADRPQLAIYGEGSMNEAYVPLPDGRTIPVTLSGGAQQGSMPTGAVPVEVNVYNQGGEQQSATSNSQFDGEKMVVDIFLKNISKPGPVRDAVKGVQ